MGTSNEMELPMNEITQEERAVIEEAAKALISELAEIGLKVMISYRKTPDGVQFRVKPPLDDLVDPILDTSKIPPVFRYKGVEYAVSTPKLPIP